MKKTATEKKVLVFGTFDGIHPGHIHFLKEAQKFGTLFVSVASDESLISRKMHKPLYKAEVRSKEVKKLGLAKSVNIGDRILGNWSEIKKIKPDIIFLGYDQDKLKEALVINKIKIGVNFILKTGKSFDPKKYHSSLMKTTEKNCVYCTLPEIKARKISENKLAWAFPTNIPIVPGHMLIASKRCVAKFEDMTEDEKRAVFNLLYKLKTALIKTFGAEGFNIAWNEGELAGQSVPHLHLHLLPRKSGDTGITKYEPRKFIYRPGSREKTPEKELMKVVELIKNNL